MSDLLRPDQIDGDLRTLLLDVPGYDPLATAGAARFDRQAAETALLFFPKLLKHVEGALAGQPFRLEPWQQTIIANLFGWKRVDAQGRTVRRFREVLIYVPRKSGKSPMAAGIALYTFFCDPMPGKQCYLAAGDREQASVVFRHCKGMIQQQPILAKKCRIYGGSNTSYNSRSIVREEEASFLRVISADAETKHGGNTHLAVIDELHVQPNRELVDVMRTSMASINVPQPLLVYLTTADYSRVSICNEVYQRACQVRDGRMADPSFLPVIYESQPDEDWTDPAVWRQANPNLGVSVSLEYLERECRMAEETPAYQNTFRRLHLNQRTQQDVRAIPMDQWDLCGEGIAADDHRAQQSWRERKLQDLTARRCAGGLDLGAVSDLTCLVLLFGDEEGGYDVLPWFWCSELRAQQRERRDRVEYTAWARLGFITLTEGNETDYQRVRQDINGLCDRFGVYEIAADRLFQGAQLCQDLIRDGLNVSAHGQGYLSMAAPTRRFLELVSEGTLRHGMNPVLRWMAGNASTESDTKSGETVLKFSRKKSTEKIDGVMAACMALGVDMLGADATNTLGIHVLAGDRQENTVAVHAADCEADDDEW